MKKVVKSPFVLDVLNIAGVQKSLERLAELLGKIQKALGEYLERERSSFPRFYFVGDEDLLEIIGNSKDVLRIQKHLKKMFAGLSAILVDEEVTQIEGMASREGEEVRFKAPIVLKDFPKINDWLTRLEGEMKRSLAHHLDIAHLRLRPLFANAEALTAESFLVWIDDSPAQLALLAVQLEYTSAVERALANGGSGLAEGPLAIVERGLDILADAVLTDLSSLHRRKCEHIITELVHERDVLRSLLAAKADSTSDFTWLYQMRFYLDEPATDPLQRLVVRIADASFVYGWEYLGAQDRLVQTPLTDRCYYTLTQALHYRLGGAPFGPAGTVLLAPSATKLALISSQGKTESVKALGAQLGRFVIVVCCDEQVRFGLSRTRSFMFLRLAQFDYQSVGRIFIGLCQVGATACFDEVPSTFAVPYSMKLIASYSSIDFRRRSSAPSRKTFRQFRPVLRVSPTPPRRRSSCTASQSASMAIPVRTACAAFSTKFTRAQACSSLLILATLVAPSSRTT